MATTADLVRAAKRTLGIGGTDPDREASFDGVLEQKVKAVVGYLTNAGVTAPVLATDLAVDVITLGVTDSWGAEGGKAEFSKLFYVQAAQLLAVSALLNVTPSPVDGASGVARNVAPTLAFDRRIQSYHVHLAEVAEDGDETDVCCDIAVDVTHKIITITPDDNLAASQRYALIVEAQAAEGPSLARTVFQFTTAT